MKRLIVILSMMLLILSLFTACNVTPETNKEDNAPTSDTSKIVTPKASPLAEGLGAAGLGEKLLSELVFEDELSLVADEIGTKLYNITDCTASSVYKGSGSTAEELAVFSFATADEAAAARELAEARIARQIESYRDYLPAEAKRLENTVIKQSSNYLVVAVTNDKAAEDLISSYLD